jgi:hypothetical protein
MKNVLPVVPTLTDFLISVLVFSSFWWLNIMCGGPSGRQKYWSYAEVYLSFFIAFALYLC